MRTIYKYPLIVTEMQDVTVVGSPQVLSVGLQGNTIMLWVLGDDEGEETLTVLIRGTGHPIPHLALPSRFVGTVSKLSGLVFHVFVVTEMVTA